MNLRVSDGGEQHGGATSPLARTEAVRSQQAHYNHDPSHGGADDHAQVIVRALCVVLSQVLSQILSPLARVERRRGRRHARLRRIRAETTLAGVTMFSTARALPSTSTPESIAVAAAGLAVFSAMAACTSARAELRGNPISSAVPFENSAAGASFGSLMRTSRSRLLGLLAGSTRAARHHFRTRGPQFSVDSELTPSPELIQADS